MSTQEVEDITTINSQQHEEMNDENKNSQQQEEILALPPPSEETIPSLQLGESIALDDLGPIIINTDGTTQRISNWKELSESERKNTLRLIALRNKKRIDELKKNSEISEDKNE